MLSDLRTRRIVGVVFAVATVGLFAGIVPVETWEALTRWLVSLVVVS